LTALAEVRRLDVEARALGVAELSARVDVLEASYAVGREAVRERALVLERIGRREAAHLETRGARIVDLQRGNDYFAVARNALDESRGEADRRARTLDAGRAQLEQARGELTQAHAEKKVTEVALERRAEDEKRRTERALEEEAEDFVRARIASHEGGLP
jgi:hypothetical protein